MRGTGYRLEEGAPADYDFGRVFGSAKSGPEAVPAASSLRRHVRQIRDQRTMNACVGFAVAQAWDVRTRYLGLELPEPSPLAIYSAAVATDTDPRAELADEGSRIGAALGLLRKVGMPREADMPWPAAGVPELARAQWHVWQGASPHRVARWGRTCKSGIARLVAVCNALASGFPVIVATETDHAFRAYRAGEVLEAPTAALGGHAMVLVGHVFDAEGALTFVGANSYGEEWGDRGYFRASWQWLAACLDVRTFEVTP